MMYKTLGEICVLEKGKVGIQKANPGEYPLVVTAENRLNCDEYQFDCNAVCIPLVSSAGHGKAAIKRIHYQTGKFALGNILCAVISKNEDYLLTKYVYVYLSVNKDDLLVPLMKGAANVSMTVKALSDVKIPVPEIKIQKEIVEKYSIMIDKIDNFIKNEEDNHNKMEMLKNILICELFYGKDSNFVNSVIQKGDYNQLTVTKNYNTNNNYNKLEEYCRLDNGIKNIDENKPYLEVKFLRGQTSLQYRNSGYLINEKEYMILVDGENSGEVFISPMEGIMGSTMKKLIIDKKIDVNYVLEFLKFHHNTFKNSKTGAAIPHLNKKLFKDILIPVPKIEEQKIILDKILKINSIYEELTGLISNNIDLSNLLLKVYIDNIVNNV